MGLSLRNLGKKVTDVASRAYDQVNIADNGLSYNTRQINPANAQRSVIQQTVAPAATALVRAPVQFVNTGNLAARQAVEGVRMANAQLTGNVGANLAASNRADANYDRFTGPGTGIMGQGSFIKDAAEAKRGDISTLTKRIGGGTLATEASIIPVGKGASVAATGGGSLAARAAIVGGQGAVAGAGMSAGTQLQDKGKINAKQLAVDTAIGGTVGAAVPLAGRGAKITLKKADNAGLTSLTPRVNAEKVNALKTVADYHAGVASPGDYSAAVKVARQAAKEQGVNIDKGSKVQRMDAVNSILDQLGKTNKQYSQAGGIPVGKLAKEKPTVTAKDPLLDVSRPTVSGVTAADKVFRSTTGVLNKIDPRLGAGVTARRELGETSAAMAKSELKITNSLNKEEQTNLARAMKGTEAPMSPKVASAVEEARGVLNKAYDDAEAAGVTLPGKRENYFPQIHNPKTFQKGSKQYKTAIETLVSTGQAKDGTEAADLLLRQRNGTKISPYQNLSKSRDIDLPGYAENNAALHQYLDRAYATTAHAHTFGPNEEKLKAILKEVDASGGDVQQAVKSYRQASGLNRGSDAGERLAGIATNLQGATKLGLSGIGNATQTSSTAVVGGVGRTAKNYFTSSFKKADKDFVAKTGVTDEQVAHEALFGEQGVSDKLRKVTAPLFEPIEKKNRATAALVGRDRANSLAKKALNGNRGALDTLNKEFGITSVPKSGLTEEQQIAAGRAMVERTQFRTGAQDLPGWASTPAGRVVTQFKRYPYKQTQFLKNEVISPALSGNLAPAARLVGVGAPVALGANAISDKIRGANFDQSAPEKVLDVVNTTLGGNLATSMAQSLYPSSRDANAYTAKVAKAVGGPTISDGIKAIQAGFDATKGKAANAERFALQHVPVVGTPLSNKVLPYADSKTGGSGASGDGKELSADDRIKQAYTTPEGKAFLKLTSDEQKDAAATDPAMRDLYDSINSAKKSFGSPKLRSQGLSDDSSKILTRFDHLTNEGKAKVLDREQDAEYKLAAAEYENKKLGGNMTDAQDIKARNELDKKKVGIDYAKNTRNIYELSKDDIYDYITTNGDGQKVMEQLAAYDKALLAAGIITKLKFKNGFDPSAKGSSNKDGVTREGADTYKFTVSEKAKGGGKKPSISFKAPAISGASSNGTKVASKPTVTMKKSRV